LLALVLLMVATVVFAGGGGQKETVLTVWDFKSGEAAAGSAFREMDRLFEQQNPGVRINRVAQPGDQAPYYAALAAAFRARTPVDIVMIHPQASAGWQFADFFEVLNLSAAERSSFASNAISASSPSNNPNGDTRMLPLTAQGMGIYTNKANLQRAGLDPNGDYSSWNAFLNACEKLRAAGIDPIIFGSPHGICFMYRVIVATFYGPERIEGFRNGQGVSFNDPEFRTASLMIRELFDKNFINRDAASISYFMDGIEAFRAGRGGFFVGLNSDIANWSDFQRALGTQNVGYFSAPVHPTARFPKAQVNQGAGIGFSVVNYSKNKALATEFVKFMTMGEGARIFMERSGAIVPNSNVPVDAGNALLSQVLSRMSSDPVNDWVGIIPVSEDDLHRVQSLFFISKEITIDQYVSQMQALFAAATR